MRRRLWSTSDRVLQSSDVFVGFLCLYLITNGLSQPFGDAVPMWLAAQNLVRHGTFAIDRAWPLNAPLGSGGHYYPVAALLACLTHVPGAALQTLLSRAAPLGTNDLPGMTPRLAPLILGAAVPALLYRMLKRIGYEQRAATWTTLLLGVGTSVWIYARLSYSEILQTACFLGFFSTLLTALRSLSRGAWLRFGLAAALLVNAKTIYFVCLPGAAAFLWWRHREREARWRLFGWAALGLAPGLVALGWYNWVRWGSIFNSGYEAVTRGFWRENVFFGLWGMLFSPGKSIFLFSPPLVLALFGIRRFTTRRREVAVAVAATVGPIVLVYARYLFWSGDWGWGPRYLVFALPVLILPLAELFDPPVEPSSPRRFRAVLASTLVVGVTIQLLGCAFVWDTFTNVARQVQRQWLGTPNTHGTVLEPFPCLSCLEETYGIDWLPPMQPIVGNWWLLRHRLAGSDWKTAATDAPWARYTSLPLNIEATYADAQIDWWPFGIEPTRRPVALLSLLFLLLAIPLRPWVNALRGPPPKL